MRFLSLSPPASLLVSALALLSVGALPAACSSTTGTGTTGTATGGGTSSTKSSTTGTGGATTTTSSSTGTGGGTGDCHAQTDCASGYFCGTLVLYPFCNGTCQSAAGDGCQSDKDCADAGTGTICDKPCVCSQGGALPANRCTKGCATSADCGPSLMCDATHRCQPLTCAKAGDCTANFSCPAAGGTCAPKACTKDADCAGFCVDGSCSPVIGACAAAVP